MVKAKSANAGLSGALLEFRDAKKEIEELQEAIASLREEKETPKTVANLRVIVLVDSSNKASASALV